MAAAAEAAALTADLGRDDDKMALVDGLKKREEEERLRREKKNAEEENEERLVEAREDAPRQDDKESSSISLGTCKDRSDFRDEIKDNSGSSPENTQDHLLVYVPVEHF